MPNRSIRCSLHLYKQFSPYSMWFHDQLAAQHNPTWQLDIGEILKFEPGRGRRGEKRITYNICCFCWTNISHPTGAHACPAICIYVLDNILPILPILAADYIHIQHHLCKYSRFSSSVPGSSPAIILSVELNIQLLGRIVLRSEFIMKTHAVWARLLL